MNYRDFFRTLIEENELDPVYVALNKRQLNREQTGIFILGTVVCDSMAVASDICLLDFRSALKKLSTVYLSSPRGGARRYARGHRYVSTIEFLRCRGSMESILKDWSHGMATVRQYPNFGDWGSFKAYDMMERVLGGVKPLTVENAGKLADDPLRGLEIISKDEGMYGTVDQRLNKIIFECQKLLAPPRFDRPVMIQEVETMLCRYKHFREGMYKIGGEKKLLKKAMEGKDDHIAKFL